MTTILEETIIEGEEPSDCPPSPRGNTEESCFKPDLTAPDKLSLYELIRTDILRCMKCKQIFQYPCVLPCLHSYCGKCIDLVAETTPDSDDVVMACPLCNAEHLIPKGGFPCNHFLLNLLEIYEAQEDEEKVCSYCQFDSISSHAVARCLQCTDDLCENCITAHKKTKLTRNHVLAPFTQVKLGKYDLDIREGQSLRCHTHPQESCSEYCMDCSVILCEECTVHNKHKKLTIERACHRTQTGIDALIANLKERVPFYETYQEYLGEYRGKLKEREKFLTEDINQQADTLHQLIEMRKAKMLEQISQTTGEVIENVDKDLQEVANVALSFQDNLQFLNCLSAHCKNEELLDLSGAIASRLNQVIHVKSHSLRNELLLQLSHPVSHDEAESAISSLIGQLSARQIPPGDQITNYAGSVNSSTMSNAVTSLFSTRITPEVLQPVELVLEFNCHFNSDSNNTWPTGVTTLPNGDIVICDRDNSTIKIFNSKGQHRTSFRGESDYKLCKPFDVTSLSCGKIVVTDYGSESVKLFTANGHGIFIISGHFEYPRGVTASRDDNILVLDAELGQVTVHSSIDGKLLRTIRGLKSSSSLIDPYYISTTRLGDVIVTDFAEPNIKVLSPEGEELQLNGEYGVSTIDGLLQPYGCCQDIYGITFIADNRNDRISVMLPNGKMERHLITKRDGLWQPIALCVDNNGHLIVTQGLGKVKVFRYV